MQRVRAVGRGRWWRSWNAGDTCSPGTNRARNGLFRGTETHTATPLLIFGRNLQQGGADRRKNETTCSFKEQIKTRSPRSPVLVDIYSGRGSVFASCCCVSGLSAETAAHLTTLTQFRFHVFGLARKKKGGDCVRHCAVGPTRECLGFSGESCTASRAERAVKASELCWAQGSRQSPRHLRSLQLHRCVELHAFDVQPQVHSVPAVDTANPGW